MKLKFRISAFVLIIALFLCACGNNDGSGFIFKYNISSNPSTLDPQTAGDTSAEQIIYNSFQGLFSVAENGGVQPQMCREYSVSDNGLVYIFKLNDNVYWKYGEDYIKCTAKDYVYSFCRLFNPTVKAARASDYFCIKNSEKINSGVLQDYSQLGVKATDDYTLEITLEKPYSLLVSLLSEIPAMPCNEEIYIKTEGRYGLEAEYTPSNGSFYVSSWNYDPWSNNNNVIVMRRNSKNSEYSKVYPYGLNFFIDAEDDYSDFVNNVTHTYVSKGDETPKLIKSGYEFESYSVSTWGIIFNTETIFTNKNIRKSLAFSLDRDDIQYASGFTMTDNIIPDGSWLIEKQYRETAGDTADYHIDASKAQEMFERGVQSLGGNTLSGTSILVPDELSDSADMIKGVLQQWQEDFNFYCGIDVKSENEYTTALEKGDFSIALVRLTAATSHPLSYLESFLSDSAGNYSNFNYSEYDDIINKAVSAEETASAGLYLSAEEYVLSNAVFVPLFNQTEYIFYGKDCKDIGYNPYSRIVIYKDAKNYS